jgi:hypothetical protein
MQDIRESQSRVALSVGNVNLQVGVQGTTKAFETMSRTCGLDDPPVLPPQASQAKK